MSQRQGNDLFVILKKTEDVREVTVGEYPVLLSYFPERLEEVYALF